MFQSSEWLWLEILVIALAIVFVATIISIYIYKKVHHMPTGDCACCHANTKKLLKQYRKSINKNK